MLLAYTCPHTRPAEAEVEEQAEAAWREQHAAKVAAAVQAAAVPWAAGGALSRLLEAVKDVPQLDGASRKVEEARLHEVAQVELLLQVGLGEAVVRQLQVRRRRVVQVRRVHPEWVKGCHRVAAGLVGVHELHHLHVVAGGLGHVARRHGRCDERLPRRHRRRRRERPPRREAGVHVLEDGLPRDVDRGGVLLPSLVHVVDIVGGRATQKGLVRVRRRRLRRLQASRTPGQQRGGPRRSGRECPEPQHGRKLSAGRAWRGWVGRRV